LRLSTRYCLARIVSPRGDKTKKLLIIASECRTVGQMITWFLCCCLMTVSYTYLVAWWLVLFPHTVSSHGQSKQYFTVRAVAIPIRKTVAGIFPCVLVCWQCNTGKWNGLDRNSPCWIGMERDTKDSSGTPLPAHAHRIVRWAKHGNRAKTWGWFRATDATRGNGSTSLQQFPGCVDNDLLFVTHVTLLITIGYQYCRLLAVTL
jgi:hypothetical protein